MATLQELLAQAEMIRTAQNVDENTAQRIGKLYNDIIVYFSDKVNRIEANKADKATTYTKSEVGQIKLELLDLIYAGL